MNTIKLIIKSFLIGFLMMFPGASGGTLAVIFSMYDELVEVISKLFVNFHNSFKYLVIFAFSLLLGIFASSKFLTYFFAKYNFELSFLFIGIVLAFTIRPPAATGWTRAAAAFGRCETNFR